MQLEGDAALPAIEARYPNMEKIITIIDAGLERVSYLHRERETDASCIS
jgi:hypothetical protein